MLSREWCNDLSYPFIPIRKLLYIYIYTYKNHIHIIPFPPKPWAPYFLHDILLFAPFFHGCFVVLPWTVKVAWHSDVPPEAWSPSDRKGQGRKVGPNVKQKPIMPLMPSMSNISWNPVKLKLITFPEMSDVQTFWSPVQPEISIGGTDVYGLFCFTPHLQWYIGAKLFALRL